MEAVKSPSIAILLARRNIGAKNIKRIARYAVWTVSRERESACVVGLYLKEKDKAGIYLIVATPYLLPQEFASRYADGGSTDTQKKKQGRRAHSGIK